MVVAQREMTDEYLGIGDVSRICGVPVHTIRYWEREFAIFLQPARTTGKQRRYSDDDIRKLVRIKEILWTRKFSIRGARRILSANLDDRITHMPQRASFIDTRKLLLRMTQYAAPSYAVSESVA